MMDWMEYENAIMMDGNIKKRIVTIDGTTYRVSGTTKALVWNGKRWVTKALARVNQFSVKIGDFAGIDMDDNVLGTKATDHPAYVLIGKLNSGAECNIYYIDKTLGRAEKTNIIAK